MKVTRYLLDNGINVVLIPIKNIEVVSMGFFIKAGARNETYDNRGIAHFLEHMMFAGTEKRPQERIFATLDNMGTEYNAVTSSEYTYYYINGNYIDTKKILDLVFDIYINPVFEHDKIKKEAKVIIEELRMRADIPYSKLYDALHRVYFKDTPLSSNIIGTEDSIKSLTQSDFIDFRNKYYVPQNTVFAMVGNFNQKQLYPIIERVLSKIPSSDDNLSVISDKKIIINNMLQQNSPYVYIKKDPSIYQAYVLLTFPLYDLYDAHEAEIDIISHLLSTGFSSRLLTSLRLNNGMTYSLTASPLTYQDGGVFVIKMVIHPDELVLGIKNILRQLYILKKKIIERQEYNKIINIIKNENIYESSQPLDLLTYFGLHFLYDNDFNPMAENIRTRNVSRRKIQEIANLIFIRDKINMFMYGNINETDFDFISL